MAYLINRYNGEELASLDDGTLDTTTSLGLLGRNYSGYGEIQNENFVFLLENFANGTSPLSPLSGQLWYNSDTGSLNIYDGNDWRSAAVTEVSRSEPQVATNGSLWVDEDTDQLYVFNNGWKLVGPQAVDGFGSTQLLSEKLLSNDGIEYPVMKLIIDDQVQAIITRNNFTIAEDERPEGFSVLRKGVNLKFDFPLIGNMIGNSSTATHLANSRAINGILFDGQEDIVIRASTTESLSAGTYLTGNDFDGSDNITWEVDATPNNIIGKVVARDSVGNFSAGTISANIIGNVTGNITSNTGTSSFNIVQANRFIGAELAGNAFSATRLETGRFINNVLFDGTANVTVPASAETLTGTRLASNVIDSSLTSLGVLNSLSIQNAGIQIENALSLFNDVDNSNGVISSNSANGLVIQSLGVGDPNLSKVLVISNTRAELLGEESKTTLMPKISGAANLGGQGYRFNKIYGNYLNAATIDTQTINSTSGDNNLTISSNLIISGNLVVNGVTTTINSTEVAIDDLLFTVAKNAANPTAANGAGISVGGAFAQLFYSATGDKWVINKKLDAQNNDIITTGLFQGTATSARYADLAEKYQADNQYEPGTVVEFGGEFEITIAKEDTQKVAGVISSCPAYLMNSELNGLNVVEVALTGRVPVKVQGSVQKGDFLVSAGNGRAKSEANPKIGSIIGKSLENSAGDKKIIEMVVGRI
jgi:hypothetical protein